MMPADQAAKVLREHNEWRQSSELNPPMPHNPKTVGLAIDAAVAALEVAAVPVAVAKDAAGIWMREFVDAVEHEAFNMRAPNTHTPVLVGMCIEARRRLLAAYCCAKCGLAETHPRERALHQDAKRGNFRQEDDGA